MPYGAQLFPGMQRVAAGAGFQTDVGTFTGVGGKVVAYRARVSLSFKYEG